MGILNVTPDSFSDGGRYLDPVRAVERLRVMAEEGADLVDVGGESTRPGSDPVPPDEQWRRIGPVLDLARRGGPSCLLSVDTTDGEVARRALDLGVSVVNDVSCLEADPRLASLAARTGAGLVLMHRQGDPKTMQTEPRYDDLLGEVRGGLAKGIAAAVAAGVDRGQIVVDPGIGFGKLLEHNLDLLLHADALEPLGRPVLVGASRKSFLKLLLDLPVAERLEGSLAAHVAAVLGGAHIVRTHDVLATRRAVGVADALLHRLSEGVS
jgi:dihydropteroate synthase